MLTFFQQKTEKKKSTEYPLKNLKSHQRAVCVQTQCSQIYKSGASYKCKYTPQISLMEAGKESKQTSRQLLFLRNLIITSSGPSLPQLSYCHSESQKGRYDTNTSTAGHGEEIGRSAVKPGAATNRVLWILTK